MNIVHLPDLADEGTGMTDAGPAVRRKKDKWVEEGLIERAQDNNDIYVRKVLQSVPGESSQPRKKLKRTYNTRHACVFCGEFVLHIPVHLRDVHKEKLGSDVLLGKDKHRYDDLRTQGDDKHNRKVLKEGRGELILARRPTTAFSVKQFGPCPYCIEWMTLDTIPSHQKTCRKRKALNMALGTPSTSTSPAAARPAIPSTCTGTPPATVGPAIPSTSTSPATAAPTKKAASEPKRALLMKSDMIAGRIKTKPSKHLVTEVFSIMTRDDISSVAQNDELIVALGESWLQRSIGNPKAKYYSSGHMRLMARLLLNLREQDVEKQDHTTSESNGELQRKRLWNFLVPTHFPDVVVAALQCAVPYMDDDQDLAAPTNAIRLKYDIARLLDCKWSKVHTSGQGSIQDTTDCDIFKRLMDIHWSERVTRMARNVLLQRSFSKDVEIPAPEDIKALTCYVVEELKTLDLTKDDALVFRRAITLVQTRLLMYNKRRSGEIDGVT